MLKYTHLSHRFVDDLPDDPDPGLLYVSTSHASATHLCCCGCGSRVVTPFSPSQWRMTFDGESVSLTPSVANFDLPCRSHYILSKGHVSEAAAYWDMQIGMNIGHEGRTAAELGSKAPGQLMIDRVLRKVRELVGWAP